MSAIKLIQGEIFTDHRGQISSLNNFCFDGVQRFYFIHHPDRQVVRGWHGHRCEKKWFYCVKGSFTLALVQPDNWDNPSDNLPVELFQMTESDSKIVCVPEGYANCLKAGKNNSTLLVFSGKRLPEAYNDSWRYDSARWVDWSKY
ncbi:hypothetical protein AGMMS4956_00490 [Bacteroidia bacterium]|nr:hypothetical protein AGMMS4956_00490 [Bacteroidia bacterium]